MAQERILIVEDNPANMLLACELLQAEGYGVIQASTGQKGIDLARKENPNLILLDIRLPDMDGFAVLRLLKTNSQTQQIPVVALTSFAMPEDVKQTIEAGFSSHITKPIDTRAFRKLVRELLEKCEGS